MIAAPQHGFVFLAMTKCASTAIEDQIEGDGMVVTRGHPRLKHMNYGGFMRWVKPMLRKSGFGPERYEVVCVYRDPISWMHSWWRYRSRRELASGSRARNYVGDVSFEEFCNAYIDGIERWATSIGRPKRFVRSPHQSVAVDRIFRYEELPRFVDYLSERLERTVALDKVNVSPVTDLRLTTATQRRLREYLAEEYDIYERLATGEPIEHPTPPDGEQADTVAWAVDGVISGEAPATNGQTPAPADT